MRCLGFLGEGVLRLDTDVQNHRDTSQNPLGSGVLRGGELGVEDVVRATNGDLVRGASVLLLPVNIGSEFGLLVKNKKLDI